MDIEIIDLTQDSDEDLDETASIYSLATLPTKREPKELEELEEIEKEREVFERSVRQHVESEVESMQEDDLDLEEQLRVEEEIGRLVEKALEEQQEREEQEWREYDEREQAMAEEQAASAMDDQDAAATATSPVSSASFVRRLFEDDAAGVGVSGDVPSNEGAVEATLMSCDDGSLAVRKIPGDGHCLYRALLHQRLPLDRRHQTPGDEEVAQLRREVATFMKSNRNTLQPYYDAAHETLDRSIALVEDGGWGDEVTLHTAANLWNVAIEVYQEYGPKYVYYPTGHASIGTSPTEPPPPLRLAFRCAPDEDDQVMRYYHYDSVVDGNQDGQQSAAAAAPNTAAATTITASTSTTTTTTTTPCATPPRRAAIVLCSPPSTPPPSSAPPSSAPSYSAPLHSTPQRASPPRSSRAPRRPRSPPATRSPTKRRCSAAEPAEPAPAKSSQELVEPASPTPGLQAPGSPNADCLSASQPSQPSQPSQDDGALVQDAQDDELHFVADEDDWDRTREASVTLDERLEDDMEGLRTTAFSPFPPVGSLILGDLTAPTDMTMLSTDSASYSLDDMPEDTGAARTREWVLSQTLPDPSDIEEIAKALQQDDEPLTREDQDHGRCDVSTGVSFICGELAHIDWPESRPSRLRSHNIPSTKPNNQRTMSTNVVFSSGMLIGTCQPDYNYDCNS